MKQWAWGTVSETLSGGWQEFIRLCNTRLGSLQQVLAGKQRDLGFYDIRDYGALVGALLTTQHVAINRAIVAANAAGGGIVFVPRGTWVVDADKNSGNSIVLLDNVTLWLTAGSVLQATANALDVSAVVYASGRSNVAVLGTGTIDGNRAAHVGSTGEHGMCLWLQGCAGVKVRDVRLINGWGDGLYLGDNSTTPNTNVDIADVVADGNRRNGFSIVGVKGGVISRCWGINTSGTSPQSGFDLEPDNAGNVDGVTVSDCVSLDNTGAAFNLTTSAKNCRLHHNYGTRCAAGGILIGATGGGNLVNHNMMSGFTASTRGIYDLGNGTVGCRLVGNEARGCETGQPGYYVHSGASGIEVIGNRVTSHNLSSSAANGFDIYAPDTIVDGNHAEDVKGIGLTTQSAAARCCVRNNSTLRTVGRGLYLDGANLQVEGNTVVDVSSVSVAMLQIVQSGAQSIGNRAILTTPNAAITPMAYGGAALFKVGNIGIGTAAYSEPLPVALIPYMGAAEAAFKVLNAAGDFTGISQYGTEVLLTSGSDATTSGIGHYSRVQTTPASFTQGLAADFYADAILKGAASTITKAVGLYAAAQTVGATNYSIETAAGGDVKFGGETETLGNLTLSVVGKGVKIKEGSNATMGAAVLVGGTVVVSTTKVTANSRILLTTQTPGGTIGAVYVSARTAGVSFTITSLNVLDTSTVAWFLVEPAP